MNIHQFLLRRNVFLRELFVSGRLIQLSILAVVSAVCNSLVPLCTGDFINSLLSVDKISAAAVRLVLLASFGFVLSGVLQWYAIQCSANYCLRIRVKLLDLATSIPPEVFEKQNSNSLALKFFRDVFNISLLLKNLPETLISALVTLAVSVFAVFQKNTALGCCFLLFLPISFLFIGPFNKRLSGLNHYFRARTDKTMDGIAVFSFSLPFLVSIASASPLDQKIVSKFSKLRDGELRLDRMNFLFDYFLRFVLFAGEYSILLVGGYLAYNGRITIGDVVAFQLLFTQLLASLSRVYMLVPMFGTVKEAMDSFEELSAKAERPGHFLVRLDDFKGIVAAESVSFSYSGGNYRAVDDFTRAFHKGEIVAITGGNGAGKTTLLKLLSAYYKPTGGKILFDGIDGESIDLSSLRENISIVFQDGYLFSMTLRENITLGKPYPQEELDRVVNLCGIDKIICKLPCGIETVLNGKINVSGGERQRIMLARALIRKPKLAIFDEINNHLDAEFRESIKKILVELKKNCCVILVSHDENIVGIADYTIKLGTDGAKEMSNNN